jgi:hypothetical protein
MFVEMTRVPLLASLPSCGYTLLNSTVLVILERDEAGKEIVKLWYMDMTRSIVIQVRDGLG